MTYIYRAIVKRLKDNAGVAALVSDRIMPLYSPQGLTSTHIVYRVAAATPQRHLSTGQPKNEDIEIEITAWATQYEAAHQLREAVRDAIDRYTGGISITVSGSPVMVTIDRCLSGSFYDEPNEDGMYGVAQTYAISYRVG